MYPPLALFCLCFFIFFFVASYYKMSITNLLTGTPALINRAFLPPPYNVAYGSFGSNQTQVVLGANTDTVITHNETYIASQTAIDPANPSRIVVSVSGVYKFSFSIQLDKAGAGVSLCEFWIKKNGINVPSSGCRAVVAGINGETFPYCEYLIQMDAGQYLEVFIVSPDTTMSAAAFAAAGTVPAVPSIITNIIQIS